MDLPEDKAKILRDWTDLDITSAGHLTTERGDWVQSGVAARGQEGEEGGAGKDPQANGTPKERYNGEAAQECPAG